MSVEATTETYEGLVAQGNVLADFWGPQCAPCLALMPAVEKLEAGSGGALRLVKVNAADNRRLCLSQRVLALPTFILYRDGEEISRLTGNPTAAAIEAAVHGLMEGGA
jgi:thioredoxin 1